MKTSSSLLAIFALLLSSTVDAQKPGRPSASLKPRKYYGPVLNPDKNVLNLTNVIPHRKVAFNYGPSGTPDTASLVNVTLSMRQPTVLLEEIASVTNVDCTSSSVAVTFNSQSAYDLSVSNWSPEGGFIIVTNHLGDCDAELERGLFLVQSVNWDATSLTVTASASKENITSTAETGEFSFGVESSTPLSKRELVLDPSYTVPFNASLTPDTTLYTYSPYLTVTANELELTSAVTFSGYLKYNFLLFKLEDLYFDIDTSIAADFEVTAEVTAAYATTFSYSPATLVYNLVDIPGILELGPSLTFTAGADLSASTAVDITAGAGLTIADGNLHLDALNSENTITSGWVPTYTAFANISGEVAATLDPYVSLTVEIAISVLGGLIDLSTGLVAKPKFENDFILTASEGVSLAGVANITNDGTCSEGLELKSSFLFTLDAFATQWYSTELYNYQKALLDECFTWA